MNDVRTLFESVLSDPPPGTLDLDRVVARGTHRRKVRRIVTAGAGLAAVLVVGSGIAFVALPDDTRTAPPVSDPTTDPGHLPDRAEVTCTPEGPVLSATEISAQAGGIALVVSSTLPNGSYLTYTSDGGSGSSGGDRLPHSSHPATWTFELAPGTLTLACDPPGDAEPSEPVTLTVTDPQGYWRGEVETGCRTATSPSWNANLFGEGDTPGEAVEGVVRGFLDESSTYIAEPSDAGYVAGNTQTWLLRKDDKPHATIVVIQQGPRYTASPDVLCTS